MRSYTGDVLVWKPSRFTAICQPDATLRYAPPWGRKDHETDGRGAPAAAPEQQKVTAEAEAPRQRESVAKSVAMPEGQPVAAEAEAPRQRERLAKSVVEGERQLRRELELLRESTAAEARELRARIEKLELDKATGVPCRMLARPRRSDTNPPVAHGTLGALADEIDEPRALRQHRRRARWRIVPRPARESTPSAKRAVEGARPRCEQSPLAHRCRHTPKVMPATRRAAQRASAPELTHVARHASSLA